MKFNWPITIHKKQIQYLQTRIENKSFPHAYLFYGPKGNAKEQLAELFYRSIMCADSKERPCGKCVPCAESLKGVYTDVEVLEREKGKKNIAISQVRKMQESLSLSSFLNSYKIAIIKEAGALTLEAANALLKNIEEPHEKTIIILLAETLRNIPLTILSRCENIKLAEIITGVCASEEEKENARLAVEFLESPLPARFRIAEDISAKSRDDVSSFALSVMEVLRNKLHQKLGLPLNEDIKLKKNFSPAHLAQMLKKTSSMRDGLSHNINARLHLENIAIE